MGMGLRFVGLMTATAVMVATSAHSAAQPADRAEVLAQTIPALIQRYAVPGAIVGVLEDGAAPFARAFGVRDTATGEPMTTDLRMRVGSITKSFTTTAVLQLAERGRITLDAPVGTYVPGVPNGDTITVRQLADMRSGLWDFAEEVIAALPNQPHRVWTPDQVLEIGYSRSPVFAPDAKWDYSNTNTALLGVIVEKVSGQRLSTFVAENILAPLNLSHTVTPVDAEFGGPHSRGYTSGPDGELLDATDWSPSWGFGAGNMISTLDDLFVWARALATGTLLSPATQHEREKFLPAPSEGDGSLYGLGVENQNGWIGHNGNIVGYQSYAYFLPSENKTLVMLINSNASALDGWYMFTEIAGIVSPKHPWPGPPKQ